MKKLYEIENLTKSYGEKSPVLDGLTFDVLVGECLVIMGRSGSGKSVTLRQLNGLESPDAGRIVFDGVDISNLTERELYPVRRRVAMLFQSGALFDSMTVAENIAFPLREHTDLDDESIRTKVAEKLRTVRLPGLEEQMPADLSGGMRKRVALARSLALEPEAVLYDEPTSGLDPMTAATIADLISHTRQELGVTSIVVSHDVALAHAIADRVAYLHRGRFEFLGTWTEAEVDRGSLFSSFLAGEAGEENAA